MSFRRRLMSGGKKKEYIKFEDPEVERICIANWSSDGVGLTYEDAERVTSLNNKFKGNTTIASFNEFQYFTNLSNFDSQFDGCSALEYVTLPDNCKIIGSYAFRKCTNLRPVNLTNIVQINRCAFQECTSFTGDLNLPNLESFDGYYETDNGWHGMQFYKTGISSISNLGKIDKIPNGQSGNSSVYGVFEGCENLQSVTLPNSLTNIGQDAF